MTNCDCNCDCRNSCEELLAACNFLCAEILNRSSHEHLLRCVAEVEVVLEEAEPRGKEKS